MILLLLVVFVAFLAEAIVGFGSTVLTVTLGAQLLPMESLLAAFVPVNMLLSTAIVARHPREVDGRLLLRRIVPAAAVGMVVGLVLFRLHPGTAAQFAFAVFVMGLSVTELFRMLGPRASAEPKPLGRVGGAALLFAGGVLHGLYGSGGPMVVYFASRQIADKTVFRSTLSALWLGLNAVFLANCASMGLVNRESLVRSATIIPPLLLAIACGEWVHKRVRERPFKLSVYILLLVAGAALARTSLSRLL